jgi:LAO/AO transport system kinase
VETVGVGQNEVEVASYVDRVIHIIDSNAGDEVQMEKAGVMEIGDIFFVNKRGDKENLQFVSSLKTFAANAIRMSGNSPKVVVGSALSGEGFEEITRLLNLCTTSSNNSNCEKTQ